MRPEIFANSVLSLPMPTFSPGLYFVPHCRTMIEPPLTTCPAKALTPRRLLWLSRPFLELPTPFLCAMVSGPFFPGSTDPDLGHGKRGERLAMPLLLREPLPPLVLGDCDTLSLAVPDGRAHHRGAAGGGGPGGGPPVGRYHQHVRGFHGRAGS